MEEKIIGVKEAAALLGVHRNTIRKMVSEGRLKAFKTKNESGHFRFRLQDIEEFKKGKEITKLSPSSITKEHLHILNDNYIKNLESGLDSPIELMKFQSFVSQANPYLIFGKYAERADNETYAKIVEGHCDVWLTQTIANIFETDKTTKTRVGSLIKEGTIRVMMGCVDLGRMRKPLTSAFVYDLGETSYVLDATLQQYITLDKGIVIMEKSIAKSFYINYTEMSVEDFIKSLLDENDSLSRSILEKTYHDEVAE